MKPVEACGELLFYKWEIVGTRGPVGVRACVSIGSKWALVIGVPVLLGMGIGCVCLPYRFVCLCVGALTVGSLVLLSTGVSVCFFVCVY